MGQNYHDLDVAERRWSFLPRRRMWDAGFPREVSDKAFFEKLALSRAALEFTTLPAFLAAYPAATEVQTMQFVSDVGVFLLLLMIQW